MEPVTKGIINLTRSNPFYGHLLIQMCRCPDPEMNKPAGVAIRNGCIKLKYNPKMLSSFSLEQLMGVLENECLHLVMAHLNRQRDRDPLMPKFENNSLTKQDDNEVVGGFRS